MNSKFLSSILSLLVLVASATVAPAQNVLLFTFSESDTNVIATVTGSFDTSGMTPGGQIAPLAPDTFRDSTGTFLAFGTTTASNVDVFDGAFAFGGPLDFLPFLSNFPVCDQGDSIVTPLSEYFEINVQTFLNTGLPINTSIRLAEGQTVFNADTLTNNVIVFKQNALSLVGLGNESGTLSTTPFTVASDPSGDNIIQFVIGIPDFAVPPVLLGDVNQDNAVNFLDISPFVGALAASSFSRAADCNEDGEVNFLDIPVFITFLSGS